MVRDTLAAAAAALDNMHPVYHAFVTMNKISKALFSVNEGD
jgi:hypothetical protein